MANETPTNHNLTVHSICHMAHYISPQSILSYLWYRGDILIRLIYERPRHLPSQLDWCSDTLQQDYNQGLRVDNFPQLQINREASVSDRGLDEK